MRSVYDDEQVSRLRCKPLPNAAVRMQPIEKISRIVTIHEFIGAKAGTRTRQVLFSLPRVKFLERKP